MRFKSAKYTGWFQPKTPQKYRGPRPNRSASIIIPFGSVDYLKPLANCLRSVRWQDSIDHEALEVLLVYLHKIPEDYREQEKNTLNELVKQYNVTMIDIQKFHDHFPLCLARNIGARAAKNDVLFFIDADTVLDPEFIVRSLRAFNEKVFVTGWFSYLKKDHGPLDEKSSVRELVPAGQVRRYAYGGGIAATKEVINEIRGFDEVYDRAWGADDNDMVDRLIEYGLDWHNVSIRENIVNLHQWHQPKNHEKDPGTIANRSRYYSLQTVIRNEDGWGEVALDWTALALPAEVEVEVEPAAPAALEVVEVVEAEVAPAALEPEKPVIAPPKVQSKKKPAQKVPGYRKWSKLWKS